MLPIAQGLVRWAVVFMLAAIIGFFASHVPRDPVHKGRFLDFAFVTALVAGGLMIFAIIVGVAST